jgi:phage gp29-like protein
VAVGNVTSNLQGVMPAEISKGVLRQLIVPQQSGMKSQWSLHQLRAALMGQRMGHLGLSSQLYDTLLEDDEIPGALRKRVNATLKSPFKLISPDGCEVPLTKREQKIEKLFKKMAPCDQTFDLVADWLMMGVGVGTIDWDTSSVPWVPYLRVLPTEFLSFDEELKAWRYQTAEFPDEIVTPGDGKWVLLTGGERGWRWGLIRAIARTWLGKQLTYCDWQQYNKKHGLPIFKALIPIWRDDIEKQTFAEELAEVVAEGVIALPQDENSQGLMQGYDVQLLEPAAVVWQGFQASLERADRKFQVLLLSGNLGSEATSKGSNRAAAETHAGGLAELAAGDAERLGYCLQQQLLRPFMMLNYGKEEPPLPFWDADPADDARAWVPAQAQLATAVKAFAEAGVEISNLAEVGRSLNLELKSDVKVGELQVHKDPPKPVAPPGGAKKPAAKKVSKKVAK